MQATLNLAQSVLDFRRNAEEWLEGATRLVVQASGTSPVEAGATASASAEGTVEQVDSEEEVERPWGPMVLAEDYCPSDLDEDPPVCADPVPSSPSSSSSGGSEQYEDPYGPSEWS